MATRSYLLDDATDAYVRAHTEPTDDVYDWLVEQTAALGDWSGMQIGYDQGVFSGVLISADFKHYFPETKKANISGITSSCFSVCP